MTYDELVRFLKENWQFIVAAAVIVAPSVTFVIWKMHKTRLETMETMIKSLELELKQKDLKIKLLQDELNSKGSNLKGASNQDGILFYQERPDSSILEDQLKETSDLWLVLFTGSVVNADHSYKLLFNNRKVRLILLNPYSTHFSAMCELFDQPVEAMSRDILSLTKRARQAGVEVKWFGKPIGAGIIISNPKSLNPWLRIEFLIPFGETKSRPVIMVDSKSATELIPKMVASFEKMWESSDDPSEA